MLRVSSGPSSRGLSFLLRDCALGLRMATGLFVVVLAPSCLFVVATRGAELDAMLGPVLMGPAFRLGTTVSLCCAFGTVLGRLSRYVWRTGRQMPVLFDDGSTSSSGRSTSSRSIRRAG